MFKQSILPYHKIYKLDHFFQFLAKQEKILFLSTSGFQIFSEGLEIKNELISITNYFKIIF